MSDELKRLESIAADSLYGAGANEATVEYSFTVFSRFMRGQSVLEMGPAEGIMTRRLAGLGMELTVVEGSARFCEDLARRFPSATVVQSLFETWEPGRRFDNIVLGHVLEHVEDATDILRRAREWLEPGGRILAAVPNSRSLHRQAGVLLGLLDFEEQLNDMDRHHGHRRVFNPETFRRAFLDAGLRIEHFGGYWLKAVSNGQTETWFSPEMLHAFMQLGERYPDIAGEIYVVAGLPAQR